MSLVDELASFARSYRGLSPRPEPKPQPLAVTVNRGGRKPGSRGKGWSALGAKHVYPTRNGRFQARIRTRGELRNLGTFATVREAMEAVARHMAKLED